MKLRYIICCLLASLIAGADEWKLEHRPGDQVALRMNDGVLELDYVMKVDQPYQSANNSFMRGTAELLLKNPLKLDAKIKRILFEASGLKPSARREPAVLLMPLLRDANGEIFCYTPHKQDHLKNGTTNWSGWQTSSFYATEAGGAAASSFEASGGDGNAWPDGELTFLGFKLAIHSHEILNEFKGKIRFGGYILGENLIPYSHPYVYADSMLTAAGKYRIAAQITRGFQAVPVREWVKELEFDPDKPSSAKQKITFELGGDDNYWIRYQITDAAGKIVTDSSMRAWVENNPLDMKLEPIDLAVPPPIGYLRLNPGHDGRGVYPTRQGATFTVRAFSGKYPEYTIKWRIEKFGYPEAVLSGRENVRFAGERMRDIAIPLALPAEGAAYCLKAEAEVDGKIIDSQDYVLGFTSDLSYEYQGRTGKRQTRDEVKKQPYVRVSYLPYKDNKKMKFASSAEAVKRFEEALASISQITRNVTFMIDTADFEILPGVFDFMLFDRVMDTAWDYGCRLTVRLSHADHSGANILRWQRYWPQRNSDGSTNFGKSYYGSFSVADREYTDNFLNAQKAINDRYRRHPAFQGYQIFEIAGEWAVLDQPWSGAVAGYEKAAIRAFREYVRKNITGDLGELNRRWSTSYAEWAQVMPPQPDFERGATPDLRPQWLDFCKFKHYLDAGYWVETAAASVRSYDQDCVIIVYSLDPGGFEDVSGAPSIDYLHNGGNHFLRGEGTLTTAWEQKRIGWITEPHMPHRWAAYGDPGNRGWLLDWTTYIMLAQAGAGGANMHIYYFPILGQEDLSLTAHYGREYAFDRFQRWLPLLQEMHGLKISRTPPEIAVLQDIYTLYCKHRTVFEPRMDDLRRWFELLKADSLTYEDFRKTAHDSYKLILPNLLDEVMSAENIELVARMVRNGSKTVISAMTGSKCPERRTQEFALLNALGIQPPQRPFETSGENITARPVDGNGFFPAGSIIPFYTLAGMKRDAGRSDMAEYFTRWPYRWLPQTDYFRIYPGHRVADGRVLAAFADGGTALSLHRCGKGEVLVFWGTPDYAPEKMPGFMQKVADWAGVVNPRQNNPVPLTLEGSHAELDRHYAIMYQDRPGTYRQKLSQVPDGEFFIDDLVSGERFGVYRSGELRGGAEWTWRDGMSPLKILRMIPRGKMQSRWTELYRISR